MALDFISAYLHHPRSWTGYAYQDLSETTPTLAQFSPESICTLSNYIALENLELSENFPSNPKLHSRITLLIASAKQNTENLYSLALHLSSDSFEKQFVSPPTKSPSATNILLLQMYFAFPNLVNSISSKFQFSIFPGIQQSRVIISCSSKHIHIVFILTSWILYFTFLFVD